MKKSPVHRLHRGRVLPLVLLAACAFITPAVHAALARPGHIQDTSMRYDEVVSVMAHNAFNHQGVNPQQSLEVRRQLERGVRAFMLDVHKHKGELTLCHATCSFITGRVAPLQDDLQVIHNFLASNPTAVVTVHMEVVGAVSAADFQHFMNMHPRLFTYVFNPDDPRWAGKANWPTVQEMIDSNQRLLLMTDRGELGGRYQGGRNYLFYDQHVVVQNTFSIGSTIFTHDYACRARWNRIGLDRETGIHGWRRLFLMNHFHSVPEQLHAGLDNRWDRIESRIVEHCGPVAKREPNFIAVDFVERGDVLEYVEHRNNGGVVAYEGNGASQDVVCGFSSAIGRRWNLQRNDRLGCENDEMRSLVLRGMKPGQRITFHDDPNGSRNDDFGVLTIDRDIPWNDPQVLYSFERSVATPYFRYLYSGGNGLDGKVSHINVEPNPVATGKTEFTLHREFNGNGRVTCGLQASRALFWNFKQTSGCHNDDAKSLRIQAADAGTVITVYDSPSGNTGDDYTTVRVKRAVVLPVVVGNLESSYENDDVAVSYRRHNGLNGKVSSVRLTLP